MNSEKTLQQYLKQKNSLRKVDRYRLDKLERAIKQRLSAKQPSDRLIDKFEHQFKRAVERAFPPIVDRLNVSFPEELPISARAEDISGLIQQHQVIIVCGATGSGKTTQLPKIALEAGRGQMGLIGCTQPRRIAAVSMATRVADELSCKLGNEVGYKVRFDNSTSDDTAIKFMTDGILLAETISDKRLNQYDTLIIDEAHERSLNIDFILGYLKNLLRVRPDLKIIISSATLDAENFSAFFNNAPVVEVEGRTYPVEDFFMEPEEDEDLSSHILRAVKWISEVDRTGDILVFLPGEREIREAADTLNGQFWKRTDILPLFARMGVSEQKKIFSPGQNRRIILATNVAETSITIPRIHYVIDSGLARISRFNPNNQVQELKIEQISRASAMQRRGRCGRIAEGICVFLYDRKTFDDSPEFTDPEIRRSSLAGVILQMESLKLPPIEDFPLIDPPQSALIRDGYRTLQNIKAMDKHRKLTQVGHDISTYPVDPHLAAMICHGQKEKVASEMLIITAFLSIMDPRERPQEKQQAADQAHGQWNDERSDFISILNLWNFIQEDAKSQTQLRKLCKKNFLNFRRVREWYNLFQDLRDTIKNNKSGTLPNAPVFKDFHYDQIHRSLLAGLPTHIARYDREKKLFRGAKNRKFYIFPGSGLFKKTPEWIISFELVNTTRLYARKIAEIDPAWVEDIAPHLCKSTYDNVQWNPDRGFVYARETVISSGLIIYGGRSVHYGKVCPDEARNIFIREGIVHANLSTKGGWLKLHRAMLEKISVYEAMLRRPGCLFDDTAVFDHFNTLLPPEVCSVKSLEQWIRKTKARIAMQLEDAVFEHIELPSPEDYPETLEFCSEQFKLVYKFDPGEIDDGAMLLCPTDLLCLLPENCPDWTVPGLLIEKVKLLIRALPKTVRTIFNPASETAERFCNAVKSGEIDTNDQLTVTLGDFLSGISSERIHSYDFDTERIPAYLTLKIAETDNHGNIKKITAGMPERSGSGSRLSHRLKGTDKWISTGLTDWPEDGVPESITLEEQNNTTGYPALTDETQSIGRQVYLDPREAAAAQRRGLIRLYRLQNTDHIKYLKRNLPLSDSVRLSLCLKDRKNAFQEDYLDAAIIASLTDDGIVDIRTENIWKQREIDTKERLLWEYLVYYASILDNIVIDKDKIERDLESVKNKDAFFHCGTDVTEHLNFLFRNGFTRTNKIFSLYPRYLKALRIRVERMLLGPGKDETKMEPIEYFQERFKIAYNSVDDYDSAFDLQEFSRLLEEFRIARFAPEVGTTEKVSEKRLLKAWNEVKL